MGRGESAASGKMKFAGEELALFLGQGGCESVYILEVTPVRNCANRRNITE